jgi:hypothetical protein
MNDSLSTPSKKKFQTSTDTEYSGAHKLWAIEKSLTQYNISLVKKISSFFKGCPRVLEFGAGIGTLAELWTKKTGSMPECLEIDQNLNKVIERKGLICYSKLEAIKGDFDGIYSSNVLEHIEHDELVLSQLYNKLKIGGVIALYVPAFMCLYSSMDLAVGHYRRYSSIELCEKLERAGFKVIHQSYSDAIGFFVWWFLKIRGSKNGGELSNHTALSLYDKFVYPISAFLDGIGFKFLFGKNLLVVATK